MTATATVTATATEAATEAETVTWPGLAFGIHGFCCRCVAVVVLVI